MTKQALNPLFTSFANDLKGTNLTKDFQTIFKDHDGNWDEIKPKLESNKAFEAVLPKLEFTQNLMVFSNNNEGFVAHFQQDSAINFVSDIGLKLNREAFVAQVRDFAPKGEDKMAFANNYFNQVFNQAPTGIMVNMIEDPKVSLLNNDKVLGKYVSQILRENLDFLTTKSAYDIVDNEENFKDIPTEKQQEVKNMIKDLNRVKSFSPTPEIFNASFEAKLTSSNKFTALPL